MSLAIVTPGETNTFRNGLVGSLKVKTLGVELFPGPLAIVSVIIMLGVEPRLKEVCIPRMAAYILRWACPGTSDAARIFDAILDFCAAEHQTVLPVVAEIVLVGHGERRIGLVRECQVLEPDLGRLENAGAIDLILDGFGRTDGQTADVELVQMAVSPSESCLQNLVELRKVEVAEQFQRPSNRRMNADNLSFEPDYKGVGIIWLEHDDNDAFDGRRRQESVEHLPTMVNPSVLN